MGTLQAEDETDLDVCYPPLSLVSNNNFLGWLEGGLSMWREAWSLGKRFKVTNRVVISAKKIRRNRAADQMDAENTPYRIHVVCVEGELHVIMNVYMTLRVT